ncbi:MAG TPA: sodium/solute symporter [Gemmataceae bacterium]|nr:sodium/solute symporter [Gemmataceae bacterium]
MLSSFHALFAEGGLQAADYVVVILYFIFMIWIGVYFSGRQKSGEDYFVAGRSMPWIAVGLSLFSALLSTISYLAVPGETISQGFAYCLGLLHIPFSYAVIYFVLIPFFMRLGVVSAYEYLERRFSRVVRVFGAGLFMLYCLGWMATVVLTCSVGLQQMTGWPLWVILICNGLVSTVYTTLGGMRAVIWTDVAQAVLMLGGGVLTLIYVGLATNTTPADWWRDAEGIGRLDFPWFSLNPSVRQSVFWIAMNMFAWMICTHGGNQVALQRYFTMSTPREARGMLLVKMAAEIIMALLLVATGFALLSFYLRRGDLLPEALSLADKQKADKIFPHFIAHQLPPVFAGGVVAALFAAAMSTISSGVNSMAAVFTIDFYQPAQPRKTSDPEQIRVGVGFTAVSGLLITAIAWGLTQLPGEHNFVDLMQKAFNFLLGPLGGLFLIGMFFPRCTTRSAIPATILGLGVGVLLAYWEQFFKEPFSPYWVIACSCGATLISAGLLGLTEPRRDRKRMAGLTWRTLVFPDGAKTPATPDQNVRS